MAFLWFAAGLFLLFAGGEALVRGAVGIARGLGVSPLLIGIVVVAFATSSPELFLSVEAVLADTPDIAIGNVIGSNIANILLVLGIGGLLAPVPSDRRVARRDGVVMLAASIGLTMLAVQGVISTQAGAAMVIALVLYLAGCYVSERNHLRARRRAEAVTDAVEHELPVPGNGAGWSFALTLGGLVALLVGANLLIDGVTELAIALGVPEGVIALSLVAVGTSLPEIATIMAAALRGHSEVAVGAVVGSNIFNVLAVLGITAIARPVVISPEWLKIDLWVMLAAAVLVVLILAFRPMIGRLTAFAMLVAYFTYVVWRYGGSMA